MLVSVAALVGATALGALDAAVPGISDSGGYRRHLVAQGQVPQHVHHLLARGVHSTSKSKWAAAGLLVLALAGCGGATSQTSATASSGGPSATPASAISPAPAAAAGTVEFDLSFNSTMDVTCRLNQQWVDTGHGNPCSGIRHRQAGQHLISQP